MSRPAAAFESLFDAGREIAAMAAILRLVTGAGWAGGAAANLGIPTLLGFGEYRCNVNSHCLRKQSKNQISIVP